MDDPAQVLRDYLTDNELEFEERDGSFSFPRLTARGVRVPRPAKAVRWHAFRFQRFLQAPPARQWNAAA